MKPSAPIACSSPSWRPASRRSGPGARAAGAGRRATCRSPAPARRGARSRSTPGGPTSGPAASWSTSPAPARPTAARSSSRRTVDFANTEIPFQNPPEPGQQAEIPGAPVRLPADRGRRHVVHVQPDRRRAAGPRPPALGAPRWPRSSPADHPLERPGDRRTTTAAAARHPDHPGGALRRRRRLGAVHAVHGAARRRRSTARSSASKLHLGGSACPSVSFYPAFGSSKAQVGSNGVANYVSASYGAGAIGYVEYAYAKRINFPVVSLLNKAGYYSQPTAGNVAVALTKAPDQPRPDPEPRVGLHEPRPARPTRCRATATWSCRRRRPRRSTTDKGKTLSTFINYFLCGGQQKADILGYSPLPKNLVHGRLRPGRADPGRRGVARRSSQCNNPALDILQVRPAARTPA